MSYSYMTNLSFSLFKNIVFLTAFGDAADMGKLQAAPPNGALICIAPLSARLRRFRSVSDSILFV